MPGTMMTEDSEKGSSVYGGLARTDSTNSLADLTLAADAVLTQGRDVRARVGFDYASDAIGERERERARKAKEIDWAMNIDLEALEKNTKVSTYVRFAIYWMIISFRLFSFPLYRFFSHVVNFSYDNSVFSIF